MIYGTIKKADCGTVTVRRFFLRALRHCALAALTWQAGFDAGIIISYIFSGVWKLREGINVKK